MSLGIQEIAVILIVMLLLFGAKRIPELAKALGRASGEFKKAKEAIKKETESITNEVKEISEVAKDDTLSETKV